MKNLLILTALLSTCAFSVAALGSPAGAAEDQRGVPSLKVRSSLNGKSTLSSRIHWLGYPDVPASQIKEVDFLIDGKLRWIEHTAPYAYGSDGDWLVTSFLTPGLHRFAVRAKATDGRTATDVHTASVVKPGALPLNVAGSWHRQIGADVAGADLAGIWHLRINSVGWGIIDPQGGPSLIDVAYLSSTVLEARGPIWTKPKGAPGTPTEGNGWCDKPFPPVRYQFTVTATTLTLHLVGEDRCGGEHGIWAGVWNRSTD